MGKSILLSILLSLSFAVGICQPLSGVAPATRDSILQVIKEGRSEEYMPGFLYLYDLIDSSTKLARFYSATAYDIDRNGFDYSKSLVDYVKFSTEDMVYCYRYDSLGKVVLLFSSVLFDGRMMIGPSSTHEQEVIGRLLDLVNIDNACIFVIQNFRYTFVSVGDEVYVYVDGNLTPANAYLKERYTVAEIADIINWRRKTK